MEALYQQELFVPISLCDREGKLAPEAAFSLFMDLASVHAQLLGVGAEDMLRRGLFWLTVKTKVRFHRRPKLMERVSVSTRPLAPEKIRSVREYRIEQDGAPLVEGKTEWAVMETASGKIHPMADVFPGDLELAKEPAFPAPFSRIDPDFSGAEALGSFRVRSVDVDIGGHMNNVAYLRAVFGVLSSAELAAMPKREIEIIFRAPCFEGEELRVLRRVTPGGWDLTALRPDGAPAVLIRAAGEALAPQGTSKTAAE